MTEPDVDALIAWHEEAARRLDGPGLGQTGDYHTKAATALRTLQERCKELEAALGPCLDQAEGCWVSHYGENPEGSPVPPHIADARAAIALAEQELETDR